MVETAPRSAGGRSGFTLLEVLVTLALIGLITGALVVGANQMMEDQPKTPAELFWAAAEAARKDALFNNRDVRLTYDDNAREFVLRSDGGEARHPFVPRETAELDFLAPKTPGNFSAILMGGELVETQTIPYVTFYNDGTCSPFRVQLKTRDGARVLEIDPWTCAPMLNDEPAR